MRLKVTTRLPLASLLLHPSLASVLLGFVWTLVQADASQWTNRRKDGHASTRTVLLSPFIPLSLRGLFRGPPSQTSCLMKEAPCRFVASTGCLGVIPAAVSRSAPLKRRRLPVVSILLCRPAGWGAYMLLCSPVPKTNQRLPSANCSRHVFAPRPLPAIQPLCAPWVLDGSCRAIA